jgi:hypothetical protein
MLRRRYPYPKVLPGRLGAGVRGSGPAAWPAQGPRMVGAELPKVEVMALIVHGLGLQSLISGPMDKFKRVHLTPFERMNPCTQLTSPHIWFTCMYHPGEPPKPLSSTDSAI